MGKKMGSRLEMTPCNGGKFNTLNNQWNMTTGDTKAHSEESMSHMVKR